VLDSRLVARHRPRIESANGFLRSRGGLAVLLGRFTAFFRAVMPALAGSARMPYRRFVTWNAIGGVIWGTSFVLLGHLAGASYAKIQAQAGRDVAIGLVAIVVLLLVLWRVRAHRTNRPIVA
jgi:membrane protein DedA with SNARE-associated domain